MKLPNRPRRMRASEFSRSLMRETSISTSDLILPLFVIEGQNKPEDVKSMPGVQRLTQDLILKKIEDAMKQKVTTFVFFPVIDKKLKSESAAEAFNSNGLIQKVVRSVKKNFPEAGVITDIALDPYTIHGQDGLMSDQGEILNDETVEILVKQAISHAEAGADIVSPSDMMDGRIRVIRDELETNKYINTKILAYSAKYASSFYGPFREAVGSAINLAGASKETYQMDPANSNEAIHETKLDLDEGADMVMVKPAMPYLDIIYRVKSELKKPTFAYQVSGEYSMIKAAAQNGWLNEQEIVLESLLGIKRAGADAILTYFALEVANWINR